MRIGAHVRTPGGLRTAIDSARVVGADAVQLFLSNPRAWAGPRPETAERFGAAWREAGVGPLYVHAPYLVNIASPNPEFVAKSLELCRRSVVACAIADAAGFVVHAGSGGPGERGDAVLRAAAKQLVHLVTRQDFAGDELRRHIARIFELPLKVPGEHFQLP